MRLVDLISEGRFADAKEFIDLQLEELAKKRLVEVKKIIATDIYEEVEEIAEANIQRMGRVQKIRRRIRRNAKGRIIVQRNVKRSGVKGYRISGNTVKRISATARIHKARMLKRSWKTTRKSKLRRSLLKRKMSMRRRSSMGIK